MTGMDAAYYEDLAGRLYGLVIRLGGRLPAGDARWLHHVTGITGAEREDMLALAARMELEGGLVPRALAACPQAAGDHGAGSR